MLSLLVLFVKIRTYTIQEDYINFIHKDKEFYQLLLFGEWMHINNGMIKIKEDILNKLIFKWSNKYNQQYKEQVSSNNNI